MKILALDTVTEACSAALWIDGEAIERFAVAPRRHTELILPMVEELLAEAGLGMGDLDALAVDRGPGSFTGVRVGIGVAQGLALARDLPVHPVSSLAALAMQVAAPAVVVPLIDARMDEVYWSVFERTGPGLRSLEAEHVTPPQAVRFPESGSVVGLGTGLHAFRERFLTMHPELIVHDTGEAPALPRAADVARLAAQEKPEQAVAPEQALPIYLRDQVVQRKA